jgi:molybdopterin synthase sulfur carrier subunit
VKVSVRYFASIRERLGSGESIDVPAGSSVAEIRDFLIGRDASHAEALAHGRALRSALNKTLCDEGVIVPADAELAFFPPVTGG